MRTTPPAHYVRHNKVTRVPRNFVYLDSEAHRTEAPNGEVQTFRCAVACHDRRRHDGTSWAEREWADFAHPLDLWGWVDLRTQARARTVVVAHNLAYDLRITHALEALPALGWALGPIRLGRGQTWCSWKRDGRTLVLVDSYAWAPVALERLGELCEIPKLPLPEWDDTDEAWLARCRRDVEILAEVWRRCMDFVRSDDLGNWKPTGAGQSWAAFRHRFMSHKVLAHDNEEVQQAERESAYTGRCETWRHGKPTGGPFTEWDYSTAYARIGAECEIPIRLAGSSTTANLEQWRRLTRRYAVLAEVTITTEVPTAPTRVDNRICWPVGTFTSTLWDNELQLALDHGAQVEVSRCWWYHRAPVLQAFSQWCLERIAPSSEPQDPVLALVVKHWSRALVGRFGARWSTWETIGTAPESGLGLSIMLDQTEGTRWQLLQVGHELKRCTEEADSPDAVVSVMAWVMAECRVRLWRLVEAAGAGEVVYMDTDAVITTNAGSEALRAASLPDLRRKGSWTALELLGPRQIETGGTLRASGIPKRSIRISERTWRGEVWSELATDIAGGTAKSVRISERTVRLRGTDTRREHLEHGATAPRRLPA